MKLNIGLDSEPRLYTVLLGESYSVKKSTALKKTLEFFGNISSSDALHVSYGAGSAEGLARELASHSDLLLAFDELKAFVEKTKLQGSVLLPMLASLFENNHWDNAIKNPKHSISVRDARLSLLGCCTTDTYSRMWTPEAIAIGFPNRLFVVAADRKAKVAWPEPPDPKVLDGVRERIRRQLERLPLNLDIEPEAKAEWKAWYKSLPDSEHSKRLDTIGFRLLALIALTTDKERVDVETIRRVVAILDYELRIRMLTDPIDADNRIARLEEKIRRSLKGKGPLSERDLRRATHGDRDGLWAFNAARTNLLNSG